MISEAPAWKAMETFDTLAVDTILIDHTCAEILPDTSRKLRVKTICTACMGLYSQKTRKGGGGGGSIQRRKKVSERDPSHRINAFFSPPRLDSKGKTTFTGNIIPKLIIICAMQPVDGASVADITDFVLATKDAFLTYSSRESYTY